MCLTCTIQSHCFDRCESDWIVRHENKTFIVLTCNICLRCICWFISNSQLATKHFIFIPFINKLCLIWSETKKLNDETRKDALFENHMVNKNINSSWHRRHLVVYRYNIEHMFKDIFKYIPLPLLAQFSFYSPLKSLTAEANQTLISNILTRNQLGQIK